MLLGIVGAVLPYVSKRLILHELDGMKIVLGLTGGCRGEGDQPWAFY